MNNLPNELTQFGADLWAIRPCLSSRSARKDSRRFMEGVTDNKPVIFPNLPIPYYIFLCGKYKGSVYT